MPITFFSEQVPFTLKNKIKIRNWINNSIENEQSILGSVNYIFTSDKYLLDINKEYLNHDYFTDIITFNYCHENQISGDIYISIDTVKNNSQRFDVSFVDELHRVMIHGVLHLIGFDDLTEEQKEIMRQKEKRIFRKI